MWCKLIDVTGQRFGRLVALEKVRKEGSTHAYWMCRCDCGNTKIVAGAALRRGYTKSCGCYKRDHPNRRKHGHSRNDNPTYNAWKGMIQRCTNPRSGSYIHYGGRGIKICEQWHNFSGFLADMGDRPEGMSLERNDVNGNYEPSNCRWIPLGEQASNTRRNRHITFNGETKTAAQWSRELGICQSGLNMRLDRLGWTAERALTTPKIELEDRHRENGTFCP